MIFFLFSFFLCYKNYSVKIEVGLSPHFLDHRGMSIILMHLINYTVYVHNYIRFSDEK